jgi:Ras-related protein Rab-6A
MVIIEKDTFINVNKWYDDVRQLRGSDIVIALVGNKTDQKEQR